MSSSSKRSKKQHRKRLELSDSSGWTHVVHGTKPRSVDKLELDKSLQSLKLDNNLTLNELVQVFHRITAQWLQSTCHIKLQSLIREEILPALQAEDPKPPNEGKKKASRITKCVCLGLGSLSASVSASPKYELAALMSILDILASYPGTSSDHADPDLNLPVLVTFQDPAFTEVDKTFLTARLGHSVVETPQAFDLIDEETFLFAPHLEHDVLASALLAAKSKTRTQKQKQKHADADPAAAMAMAPKHTGAEGKDATGERDEDGDRQNWLPPLCMANSDSELLDPSSPNPHPALSTSTSADPARTALLEFLATDERSGWIGRPMPEFERDNWCCLTSIYYRHGRTKNE